MRNQKTDGTASSAPRRLSSRVRGMPKIHPTTMISIVARTKMQTVPTQKSIVSSASRSFEKYTTSSPPIAVIMPRHVTDIRRPIPRPSSKNAMAG